MRQTSIGVGMMAEWGPWRTDTPSIRNGWYIQVEGRLDDGEVRASEGIVVGADGEMFDMVPKPDFHGCKAERFRVRKPKGLSILEGLLNEVEREDEHA